MRRVFFYFLSVAIFVPLLPLMTSIWIGILEPIAIWLRDGYFPDRDVKFLLSSPYCKLTDWEPMGFKGMDICRREFIYFSEWVGVNRILNGLAEVNLAIWTILFSPVLIFFASYFWVKAEGKI